MASPLDNEINLQLSRRQVMTIAAALNRYLDYWEQHAATGWRRYLGEVQRHGGVRGSVYRSV